MKNFDDMLNGIKRQKAVAVRKISMAAETVKNNQLRRMSNETYTNSSTEPIHAAHAESEDYADFIKDEKHTNKNYSLDENKIKDQTRMPGLKLRMLRREQKQKTQKRSGSSLGGINENEELQTRPMSAMPGMNLEENDGKHYWLKCMFKNPTFCLVCGKIVSVLGDVPRDEENRVPESAIKYGPLVDRTGYRCKKCMMNIHIDCAREAERLKISMVCFGTPDPRSTHKLFPEHGFGNFNFSRHLSICEQSQKMGGRRNSLSSMSDPLEQIDEAYQVLKQGKALRLVQTGEDIREGKSMKKSIADPVFWKALFSKKSSLIEEDDGRGKKSFFGGLMSRSTKMPKAAARDPYCALYEFRPRDKQDISLRPGEKLYVFDAKDDNWWFGQKEGPKKQTGFFPAKFVMKIEETEKPFLVTRHCFGNSRRKELKAKENTIVVVNYAQPIQREDCLFVRSPEGEGFVPKDVLRNL